MGEKVVTHGGKSGNTQGQKKCLSSQQRRGFAGLAKNDISFISYISFIGTGWGCLTHPALCFNLDTKNGGIGIKNESHNRQPKQI